MCKIRRVFFGVIQFLLVIDNTKQSKIKQGIKAFKAIGNAIENPFVKTIGNTFEKPIMKTFGNTIKNPMIMSRWKKNTIKNVGFGLEKGAEKYSTTYHNTRLRFVQDLGKKGIHKFKQKSTLGVGNLLFKTEGKKNTQMRSAMQIRKELIALVEMISRKPQIQLFMAGSVMGLQNIPEASISGTESKETTESLADVCKKPKIIFILGGPGSGKGTQSKKLVDNCGFVHFSVGDQLRNEIAKGGPEAQQIENYIKGGNIVPGKVTVNLLKKAMKEKGWEKSKFQIDGFPRNQANQDDFRNVIGDTVDVRGVLQQDLSEEIMTERIKKRAAEAGPTTKRSDNNAEAIKKRFDVFNNDTKPIIEQYEKKNHCYRISSDNTIEGVFQDVKKVVDQIINIP